MRWLAYMTRIRMGTFSTIGTPFFFRLSNAKMMFRLIFIIGCVWNSTPKYTPNIWNSKRYSERFRFTMYSKLCVIISNLQFYDISLTYRFESLPLRWTCWTEMVSKRTKSYKSMICGFFYCPKVLLPRLQKYGKRQSFVTKSLPIPHRTKTVTICP